MRKIVFFMDAGLVGTDQYEPYLVENTVTDTELDGIAWELAIDHANSYGDVTPDDSVDEDNEDQIYESSVNHGWADYNPEEHDGHLTDEFRPL